MASTHLFSRRLDKLRRLVYLAWIRGGKRTFTTFFETYLFAYRRFYLAFNPTSELAAPPLTGNDFLYRIANLEDLDQLSAAFEPYRTGAEFRDWMKNGWVFVAWYRDLPVAFSVVSRATPIIPPFCSIHLRADQLWVEDLYTLTAHRRRHVAWRLVSYRDYVLLEWGFRETVATTRYDNPAGVGHQRKKASSEIYCFTYIRFLWFSRIKKELVTDDASRG